MKRALAVALLLAGCGSPRTEVVVTVHATGIRIPDDVDALRLQIADRASSATDDLLFDQPVPLCTDSTAGSADCYTLPVTVTLFPGSMRPHDSVRVQVDAQRQGMPVIADAALFTFSEGHSLRLDVILYANCLGNTDCAKRDQACGPDDMCVSLTPTPIGDEPDLAALDLSVTDGPAPIDFANLHDFTVPVDMTLPDLSGVDLTGCVPQCAANGWQCGFDGCSSTCGVCGSHTFCDVGQTCTPCGTVNMQCCPPGTGKLKAGQPIPWSLPGGCDPGLVCDGTNTCITPPDMTICGQLNEPCCDGVTCFSGMCIGGTCQVMDMTTAPDLTPCGNLGQVCCDGVGCFAGTCFGGICQMFDMTVSPG